MKKNIIKGVVSALALAFVIGTVPVDANSVEAASKPKIGSFTESNVNAYNKIKVTFKAKGTKSYKVQVSTKKSSGYNKVSYKKSDNGSKETFTIKKVGTSKIAANKTYYVKVTVYAKANYKGSKVTKTYKVYSAPTSVSAIKVTNTDTANQTIKWSKVKGASGYYVTYNGVTKKATKASLSVSLANGSYAAKVVPYSVKKVNGKNVTLKSSSFSKKFTVKIASTTTNNTNSSENTSSNNSGSSSGGSSTSNNNVVNTIEEVDTGTLVWHNTLVGNYVFVSALENFPCYYDNWVPSGKRYSNPTWSNFDNYTIPEWASQGSYVSGSPMLEEEVSDVLHYLNLMRDEYTTGGEVWKNTWYSVWENVKYTQYKNGYEVEYEDENDPWGNYKQNIVYWENSEHYLPGWP